MIQLHRAAKPVRWNVTNMSPAKILTNYHSTRQSRETLLENNRKNRHRPYPPPHVKNEKKKNYCGPTQLKTSDDKHKLYDKQCQSIMARVACAGSSTSFIQQSRIIERCCCSMGQTSSMSATTTTRTSTTTTEVVDGGSVGGGQRCDLQCVCCKEKSGGECEIVGDVGHVVGSGKVNQVYSAWSVTGTVHVEVGDENQDGWWVGSTRDSSWSVYGVLDAHGECGVDAREVVGRGIVCGILKRLEDVAVDDLDGEEDVGNAVERVIKDVWTDVGKEIEGMDWANGSGTTVTVCVLGGGMCVVANAGDSNAVIGRKLNVMADDGEMEERIQGLLACPVHRVSNAEERRRVESSGAKISGEYVFGNDHIMTSVTRSLGDLELRNLGITDRPEVTRWPLTEKEDFLILATDGLWDAYEGDITPQVASSMVGRHKLIYGVKRKSPSEMLCNRAGHPGPLDDCTVLIVFLN